MTTQLAQLPVEVIKLILTFITLDNDQMNFSILNKHWNICSKSKLERIYPLETKITVLLLRRISHISIKNRYYKLHLLVHILSNSSLLSTITIERRHNYSAVLLVNIIQALSERATLINIPPMEKKLGFQQHKN